VCPLYLHCLHSLSIYRLIVVVLPVYVPMLMA
jgi:hypothetical protein